MPAGRQASQSSPHAQPPTPPQPSPRMRDDARAWARAAPALTCRAGLTRPDTAQYDRSTRLSNKLACTAADKHAGGTRATEWVSGGDIGLVQPINELVCFLHPHVRYPLQRRQVKRPQTREANTHSPGAAIRESGAEPAATLAAASCMQAPVVRGTMIVGAGARRAPVRPTRQPRTNVHERRGRELRTHSCRARAPTAPATTAANTVWCGSLASRVATS
jgi:hypothetical protein